MYRKPCIDVTQFCNDLCIGHDVAMIRDTFVALRCSPIHAEPTGFAVSYYQKIQLCTQNLIDIRSKNLISKFNLRRTNDFRLLIWNKRIQDLKIGIKKYSKL